MTRLAIALLLFVPLAVRPTEVAAQVQCTSAAQCDDQDPCTVDACDAGVCSHAVQPDGTACDNADACFFDTCKAGLCTNPSACDKTTFTQTGAGIKMEWHKDVTATPVLRGEYCDGEASITCAQAQAILGADTLSCDGAGLARIAMTSHEVGGLVVTTIANKNKRAPVNRHTGRALLRLKLNRLGRALLTAASLQSRTVEVQVEMALHKPNAAVTTLVKLLAMRKPPPARR